MTNTARGEVSLMIGERNARLCLTLGALAEIEVGLECASISDLGPRLSQLSISDMRVVLAALLRGGGCREIADSIDQYVLDIPQISSAIVHAFELAFVGDAR